MDRDEFILEIRAIAAKNSGVPPGWQKFSSETRVSESSWRGKYWARWGDALIEAGFAPNKLNEKYDRVFLLTKLAELTMRLGRYPVVSEFKLSKQKDESLPSYEAFSQLGDKFRRIEALRKFVLSSSEFQEVAKLLPQKNEGVSDDPEQVESGKEASDGFVYMLKLGKRCKIGKTFSVPRRHREISLELPDKPDVVHSIRTDDPDGIEKYWHGRFEKKRTNGEWFALDAADIRAFKKRKFM